MAIITMPTTLRPAEFGMSQVRYDMIEASDATGAEAARLFGPPRWAMSMSSGDAMTLTESGKWAAMLLQLRGRVNVLAAFDPVRTAPEGTLRGSPRLAADVAAGATTCTLIGGSNGTLLAGDALQIGTGLGSSQVVKLVADATSSPATLTTIVWQNATPATIAWQNASLQTVTWGDTGTMAITFEPPARYAYPQDTTVTWDRPITYCRMQNERASWKFNSRGRRKEGGYAVDLLEAFT